LVVERESARLALRSLICLGEEKCSKCLNVAYIRSFGPRQSTNARFVERQECFQRQYANYTVVGPDGRHYPINSKFTGGEDGADAGGIAQSFSAWQSRLDADPRGERYSNWMLPGFEGWTREQLFFVAFAQGWARKSTPAEDVRRIRVDPHSPTKYRGASSMTPSAVSRRRPLRMTCG
jgi:predicted metalloendopeptidase